MKNRSIIGFVLVAAAFAIGSSPQPTFGQAGTDDPLLIPLIEELTKQQSTLVENQRQIEEKLAGIAEDLRVARIFIGRGGGKVQAK